MPQQAAPPTSPRTRIGAEPGRAPAHVGEREPPPPEQSEPEDPTERENADRQQHGEGRGIDRPQVFTAGHPCEDDEAEDPGHRQERDEEQRVPQPRRAPERPARSASGPRQPSRTSLPSSRERRCRSVSSPRRSRASASADGRRDGLGRADGNPAARRGVTTVLPDHYSGPAECTDGGGERWKPQTGHPRRHARRARRRSQFARATSAPASRLKRPASCHAGTPVEAAAGGTLPASTGRCPDTRETPSRSASSGAPRVLVLSARRRSSGDTRPPPKRRGRPVRSSVRALSPRWRWCRAAAARSRAAASGRRRGPPPAPLRGGMISSAGLSTSRSRCLYCGRPVPAGISRPMMTFSLRPRR